MNAFASSPLLTSVVEYISLGLEFAAVIIITLAVIIALANLVRHILKHDSTHVCIDAFKRTAGKGIQVALELLIAADIIHTIVLSVDIQDVLILAVLVLIRTFLSWTLIFETEGRWPWGRAD